MTRQKPFIKQGLKIIAWLTLLPLTAGALILVWRFSQPLWRALGLTSGWPLDRPLGYGLLLSISLLALLLAGGFFLRYRAQNRPQAAAAQPAADQAWALARDRAEERAWQRYLEVISGLLLQKGLRTAAGEAEVRVLARARTLAVLRELSDRRKGHLVRFLSEVKLIERKNPVIRLSGADLNWADLNWADLRGVHLSGVDLRGAGLIGADLLGVNLVGADLTAANLAAADLTWADLRGASLERADLREAALGWADLRGAGLAWADLRQASLERADLRGANLHGANLRQANLEGALLSRTNLQGAVLHEAVMPDGRRKGVWRATLRLLGTWVNRP